MVLRPRAARPEDWTGKLSDLLVGIVFLAAAIAVLLARLPDAWAEAVDGRRWIIRGALLVLLFVVNVWVGSAVRMVLPRAPYLFGRTLTVRERGRRVRLPVAEIAAIHVEPRPPDERDTFVVALKSGATHDLCPIAWQGAARLYARLVRMLPRARA